MTWNEKQTSNIYLEEFIIYFHFSTYSHWRKKNKDLFELRNGFSRKFVTCHSRKEEIDIRCRLISSSFWGGDPVEWIQHLRNSWNRQEFDQHRNWDASNKNVKSVGSGAQSIAKLLMTRARCVRLYLLWLRTHIPLMGRQMSHIARNWFERSKSLFRPSEFSFGPLPRLPTAVCCGHGSHYTNQITAKIKQRIVCSRARLPPAHFSKKMNSFRRAWFPAVQSTIFPVLHIRNNLVKWIQFDDKVQTH